MNWEWQQAVIRGHRRGCATFFRFVLKALHRKQHNVDSQATHSKELRGYRAKLSVDYSQKSVKRGFAS